MSSAHTLAIVAFIALDLCSATAQAASIPISAFSGQETVIPFATSLSPTAGPVTYEGVTLTAAAGALGTANYGNMYNFPGASGGQALYDNVVAGSDFSIGFVSPINRVGMLLAGGNSNTSWNVTIRDQSGTVIESQTVMFTVAVGFPNDPPVFAGFESSTPIYSVRVHETGNNGQYTGLDDLRFEQFTPTSTPTETPTQTPTETSTQTLTPTPTATLAAGCPSVADMGCRTAQKSLLLLKHNTDNNKDKLIWKWINGLATSQLELSDPTATADYALCVYDASGFLLGAGVPANAMKWSVLSDKGYKYNDLAGSADGITKMLLKGNATADKAKALVKGKGADLPDPALGSLPLPVTVQLHNEQTGICLEGVYDSTAVVKNDGGQFKAKAQ